MENTIGCLPSERSWNVINEADFKASVKYVFKEVANALSKTLGPYGSTTIIEQFGEMHFTKDGWQVLKSFHYSNPMLENILMLLIRISGQVVVQVGDGSTSSIVAANSILDSFAKSDENIEKCRPKELLDRLTSCVDVITERIYKSAKQIDRDGDFNEIHDVAYIATNGNDEIADIITNIYRETHNPAIDYSESKTEETSFEIIDGYKIDMSYLDNIFITSDDGICRVKKPYVLMFGYKIDNENALPIISKAASIAAGEGRRLIVIAPNYDTLLLNYIRTNINREFRERGTSTCIYAYMSTTTNMNKLLYNDFAIMCGGEIIKEPYGDPIDPETTIEYLGEVEVAEIGPKTTLINGFFKRNQNMYEKILLDATTRYNDSEEKNRSRGIVDTSLNETKKRLAKLNGHMGVIHVGGKTTLEKRANFDLVEDAVKASESAYTYGYNIGGGFSIMYAIHDIIFGPDMLTENDQIIFNIIKKAFEDVFGIIIRNKFGKDADVENIIDGCYGRYTHDNTPVCYDLVNDSYTDKIINSCRTDIEILKGAMSVIGLILTSNQYVSITAQKK